MYGLFLVIFFFILLLLKSLFAFCACAYIVRAHLSCPKKKKIYMNIISGGGSSKNNRYSISPLESEEEK